MPQRTRTSKARLGLRQTACKVGEVPGKGQDAGPGVDPEAGGRLTGSICNRMSHMRHPDANRGGRGRGKRVDGVICNAMSHMRHPDVNGRAVGGQAMELSLEFAVPPDLRCPGA
jgi:hypothetical protein